MNPRTKETFVLLRVDEYERLTEDYDDSPWTREELEAWPGRRANDRLEVDHYEPQAMIGLSATQSEVHWLATPDARRESVLRPLY